MRVFIALLELNFKIIVQYRKALMLSMIGDPILLFIIIMNFTAIYAYNSSLTILGYNLSQMIWYFAGITLIWYCIWNTTDENISRRILSGDLTIDLLRPVPIFLLELANALSGRIIAFIIEFIPCAIIFSIFFFPDFITPLSIIKFLIIIIISFFLYFLINFLIGLSAFSIKSNQSLRNIKIVLISLLAGACIPLDFFPVWVRKIAGVLPFQYLFYWPLQVLLNKEIVQGIKPFLTILGFQLFWIIILSILCKVLWKIAIKKYCAAGG